MTPRDSGPNFPSHTPEYFNQVDEAMRAEIMAAALMTARPDDLHAASDEVRALEASDSHFSGWTEVFSRGHAVMQRAIFTHDQRYWRFNLPMPIIKLDNTLSDEERVATTNLVEMLLWTRVREEPTGMTTYPQAPSGESIREAFESLQLELLNGDKSGLLTRDHLPGITWSSIINAMLTGQVSVGLHI